MIPGSNLLNMAHRLIAKQTVGYLRAVGDYANDLGYKIPMYATRTTLQGSFQPVPRRLYQIYGLEMEKNYATFYVSNDVQDIQRAREPDLIEFNGRRWLCQTENDWFPIDGWTGILVVDVGPVPATPPAFGAGDWSLTTNDQNQIAMTVTAWPGGAPDYIERSINGGVAETIMFPYSGILPADTVSVKIVAVLNGARSLANEKVV